MATKEELAAELAELRAEVAALRKLLKTISQVGKLPLPGHDQWGAYEQATANRLYEIRYTAHDASYSHASTVDVLADQLTAKFPELGYRPHGDEDSAAYKAAAETVTRISEEVDAAVLRFGAETAAAVDVDEEAAAAVDVDEEAAAAVAGVVVGWDGPVDYGPS